MNLDLGEPTGRDISADADLLLRYEDRGMSPEDGMYFRPLANILDTKKKPSFRVYDIDPECGWVLKPGIGYLMHTLERVSSDFYDPVLDGKSSIGRLFIAVHITAGYGDPGFPGNWTLEVTAQHPVRLPQLQPSGAGPYDRERR